MNIHELRGFSYKWKKKHDLKDTNDISNNLRSWWVISFKQMLKGEFDDELGYDNYVYSNKQTNNAKNGFSENYEKRILWYRYQRIVMVDLNHSSQFFIVFICHFQNRFLFTMYFTFFSVVISLSSLLLHFFCHSSQSFFLMFHFAYLHK